MKKNFLCIWGWIVNVMYHCFKVRRCFYKEKVSFPLDQNRICVKTILGDSRSISWWHCQFVVIFFILLFIYSTDFLWSTTVPT